MSPGVLASFAPVTRICICTVSPTATCELLKTAVTRGELAATAMIGAIPISARSQSESVLRINILDEAGATFTNRYRHGVQPCVHPVAPGLLHLSSIAKAPGPAASSSRHLFQPLL